MINYIERKDGNTYENGKRIDKRFGVYLEQLSNRNLRSIEGIRKSISKIIGYKRRIPLFIDRETILIKVIGNRSTDEILYVNHMSISNIKESGQSISFIFKDGSTLNCNADYDKTMLMMKRADIIAKYAEENFL